MIKKNETFNNYDLLEDTNLSEHQTRMGQDSNILTL